MPQPVRSNAGARVELRRRQVAERAAERDAAGRLLGDGPYDRVLDGTLVYSADGTRCAYTARAGGVCPSFLA